MQCESITKQGRRCRNAAAEDAPYCSVHARGEESPHVSPHTAVHERCDSSASTAPSSNGTACKDEPQDDPLRAVAEAMFRAAEDADLEQTPARETSRPKGRALSQAVYSTSYCVGYGVAFPAYLVIGVLPKGPMGDGLRDGARAAREAAEARE